MAHGHTRMWRRALLLRGDDESADQKEASCVYLAMAQCTGCDDKLLQCLMLVEYHLMISLFNCEAFATVQHKLRVLACLPKRKES